MKNQNGITLIALVITIIVLLILAGVAIAMLSGENGILKKASDASEDTKISSAKEIAVTDLADVIADYYNTKYVESNTTNTADVLTYIKANWVSSDATQYTYDKNTTVTITPALGDGTKVTGTLQDDGKIDWSND